MTTRLCLFVLLASPVLADDALPMKVSPAPAAATIAEAPVVPAALPDGRELLRAYVAASGGANALDGVENAIIRTTYAIPAQGMSGTLTVTLARPNKLRTVADLTGIGRVEQGYDGTTGWETSPLTGARRLSSIELEQLRQSETNIFNLASLESQYSEAETLGRKPFGGADAWEVRLVGTSGRESLAYFDPDSRLMTGLKTTVASQVGNIPAEIFLTDYKSFGKLLLPSKSRQVLLGGMIEATSTIEGVELNAPAERLPSFAPPPEVMALEGAP